MNSVQLYGLYRVTIPGGGSEYWRVLEIAADGILWACLAVGRRSEWRRRMRHWWGSEFGMNYLVGERGI